VAFDHPLGGVALVGASIGDIDGIGVISQGDKVLDEGVAVTCAVRGRADLGIDDVAGIYLERSLKVGWIPAENGIIRGAEGGTVGFGPNASDEGSLIVAGLDRVILDVAVQAHPCELIVEIAPAGTESWFAGGNGKEIVDIAERLGRAVFGDAFGEDGTGPVERCRSSGNGGSNGGPYLIDGQGCERAVARKFGGRDGLEFAVPALLGCEHNPGPSGVVIGLGLRIGACAESVACEVLVAGVDAIELAGCISNGVVPAMLVTRLALLGSSSRAELASAASNDAKATRARQASPANLRCSLRFVSQLH
jgi:hypothetical protein